MRRLFKWFFPLYINIWSDYWLAFWSAPDYSCGETDWQALRITLRKGPYHSNMVRVLKEGFV